MELSDFKIGDQFWTRTGRWQVTDIGSRTLICIKYPRDKRDLNGPPYGIVEHAMDEYDIEVLYPTLEKMIADYRECEDQEGIDTLLAVYTLDGEFIDPET